MSWELVQLKDYVFFQEGPGLRTFQWADAGMKVINVKNILSDGSGTVDTSNTDKFISDGEFQQKYRHFEIQSGDFVVASSGNTYGKVGVIRDHNLPLMMNTSVIRFRPLDENILSRAFLYAFLRSDLFSDQVEQFVTGGAQPNFGPTHVKQMKLPLPDLPTQQRIAGILSAYDDLIENNRRRIGLLEQAARLLYREWFVHLRFPGHETAKIVDGLPEGWERKRIGDITTKLGSGATPRGGESAYEPTGMTLIRSLNVYDFSFHDDGLAFINQDQAKKLANVTVESQDVLINITGASVARCCMVPERHLPARVNQHVMIVRVDPQKASPFFVLHSINSHQYKQRLLSVARAGGATREAITKDTMAGFEILCAQQDLVGEFHMKCAAMHEQSERLSAQNAQLTRARDLLLPRLMDGRIPV